MKGYRFRIPVVPALLLPLLLACQAREAQAPEETAPEIVRAEMEGVADPASKVSMDADYHAFWNADDRISVFAKTTQNRQFRFLGEEGDVSGEFYAVTATVSSPELPHSYAASPYRADNAVSAEGVISMTLPAAQQYRPGSFDPAAQLMVAVSDTRSFSFRNVCSMLGIRLYGDGVRVRSVSLKGHASEVLAGKVLVTPGDVPAMAFAAEGQSTQITLTAATPVELDATEPTLFWMVLPPVTFSSGWTVTVVDADGNTFEQSLTNSLTLERNHVYRLSAIEAVPVPPGAPTALGIYPNYRSGGEPYVYDPAVEQVSVYEAEGRVWVRFINPATLRMLEAGPIATSVQEGDTVPLTLTETVAGNETSRKDYSMEALSLTGGVLTLVGPGETYFVLRF